MRVGEATIDRLVSGVSGALMVGPRRAADLGAWGLSLAAVSPPVYRLTARLRATSPYWLAQRPISVVLDVGARTWRWDGVEIETDGGRGQVVALISSRPAVTVRA